MLSPSLNNYITHDTVSTSGYTFVCLQYYIKITSLMDSKDFTFIEYSIGNTDFITFKMYDNTPIERTETIWLPSQAANVNDLRIRFRINGTDSTDVVYLDDITLLTKSSAKIGTFSYT